MIEEKKDVKKAIAFIGETDILKVLWPHNLFEYILKVLTLRCWTTGVPLS